jgi:hypothetical protein
LPSILAELEAAAIQLAPPPPPRRPRLEPLAANEPLDLTLLIATVRRRRDPG